MNIMSEMLRKAHYLYEKDSHIFFDTKNNINNRFTGLLPSLYPEFLGSKSFKSKNRIRFAYVSGAMARGIASEKLVIEVARHGGMGFFGSAGLSLQRIEKAIDILNAELGSKNLSFGVNLIRNLKDPNAEMKQVSLFLHKGVKNIEAAAFTEVTPAVIYFAFKGIYVNSQNQIVRPNQVFAKVSHEAVATSFLSPPDQLLLNNLVQQGYLTIQEAFLAAKIPVSENIIAEADSGGHTDNRPAFALFSVIKYTAKKIVKKYNYSNFPFVGLAGGLGTPEGLCAAFELGADFVVLGSVHQSCIESGTSGMAKKILEKAQISDYTMTAAADMFEEGVRVQVLKRGTLMPMRGNRLYELYKQYDSLEAIPQSIKNDLEKQIFKVPLEQIWEQTHAYFKINEPTQLDEAIKNPKHKLALIFRWYLGKSNQWPLEGNTERKLDFQIWSGPALGAFNAWAKDTFLDKVENRAVGQVMLNLLEGTAYCKRIQQLRSFGVSIENISEYTPRLLQL